MRSLAELLERHPPECHVRSWPTAFEQIVRSRAMHNSILQDCANAATARAAMMSSYSEGTTFWIGALDDRSKMSTLERLAYDLFYSHFRLFENQMAAEQQRQHEDSSSSYDKRQKSARAWTVKDVDLHCSGAEWWTLSMDGQDGGVGWHWDKDYHAESEHGKNIHPYLGTVTYFTDVGAPTVVFDKTTAGPDVSVEDYSSDGGPISKSYISKPLAGKHICFYGRLLHAAPTDLYDQLLEHLPPLSYSSKKKKGPRPKRATFLVNIWINHKPHDANRIDPALQSKLSKFAVSVDLLQHATSIPFQIHVVSKSQNPIKKSSDSHNKNQSKTKVRTGRGQHQETGKENERSMATTNEVSRFDWELTQQARMVAEMPIPAVVDGWNKADMIAISWGKGSQRPYIERQ